MERGKSSWSCRNVSAAVITLLSFLVGQSANEGKTAQGADKHAPPSFEPEVAVQADDYGEVRKTFRTKLSRAGLRRRKNP